MLIEDVTIRHSIFIFYLKLGVTDHALICPFNQTEPVWRSEKERKEKERKTNKKTSA